MEKQAMFPSPEKIAASAKTERQSNFELGKLVTLTAEKISSAVMKILKRKEMTHENNS